MKKFIVEKEFEHMGLKCVVTFMYFGHRNGYVGVPKGHKNYGKHYNEIDNIYVHGGLTYSGDGNYPIESDLHWFGFDCAHLYDGQDLEKAKEFFPEYAESYKSGLMNLDSMGSEAKSLEYVEYECRKLAQQLSEGE